MKTLLQAAKTAPSAEFFKGYRAAYRWKGRLDSVDDPTRLTQLIVSIIQEGYSDGIDALLSYAIEGETIYGRFQDSNETFGYTIKDDEITFWPLGNLARSDSLYATWRRDATIPKKKKNCTKGRACGNGCISSNKKCKVKPSPKGQQNIAEAKALIRGETLTSVKTKAKNSNPRVSTETQQVDPFSPENNADFPKEGETKAKSKKKAREKKESQDPVNQTDEKKNKSKEVDAQTSRKVSDAVPVRSDKIDELEKALSERFGQKTLDDATQNVQAILDKADIYIRVPSSSVISQIIQGGRFKPSGEISEDELKKRDINPEKKGSGWLSSFLDEMDDEMDRNEFDPFSDEAVAIESELRDRIDYQNLRDEVESIAFGNEINERPYSERPIYGYYADSNDFGDDSHKGVGQYGSIAVKLKPSAKERATVTGGDSFEAAVPSPANKYSAASVFRSGVSRGRQIASDPNAEDLLNKAKNANSIAELNAASSAIYSEAQIHGQVKSSDIAALVFTEGTKPTQDIIDWAVANNVQIEVQ